MIHLCHYSGPTVKHTWAYKTYLKPVLRNVRTTMNGTHTITALRRWSCQDKQLPPVAQIKFIYVYDFDNTSELDISKLQL
jgi:hypothetical protein